MTDKTASFGLFALILLAAGLLLTDGGWFGLTNGMTQSPTFTTHPGRWGLVIASTLQLSLPATLLYAGWKPKPLLLTSLALLPFTLGYFLILREPDGREPITEMDQVILIALGLLLAITLLFKARTKPGKQKVPYITTGLWSLGVLVIQVLFHLTLIFPASTLETERAQHHQTIIANSTSQDLTRLIALGALPLVSLETTDLTTAGVARDDSVTHALDNIRTDNITTIHTWKVDGIKDVDQIYVVYDGTTDTAWIAPRDVYMTARLMAMKAYNTGMALFVIVWFGGLLWINAIHSRKP